MEKIAVTTGATYINSGIEIEKCVGKFRFCFRIVLNTQKFFSSRKRNKLQIEEILRRQNIWWYKSWLIHCLLWYLHVGNQFQGHWSTLVNLERKTPSAWKQSEKSLFILFLWKINNFKLYSLNSHNSSHTTLVPEDTKKQSLSWCRATFWLAASSLSVQDHYNFHY